MKSITLHLPEPPTGNLYWRYAGGRIYLSKDAKAYRLAVYGCYVKQMGTLRVQFPEGEIAVSLRWFRSQRRGDLDNHIKQVLDALQGLAYGNDAQIVEIQAFRADRSKNGGLTVHITGV